LRSSAPAIVAKIADNLTMPANWLQPYLISLHHNTVQAIAHLILLFSGVRERR
jgi:hypothetical protein